MMKEPAVHLTLKRAAQALGVHEQTLRSWEKRGLVRMVRLPGSHYRRVPVEEVERLARTMNASSPMPAVRLAAPDGNPEARQKALELANIVCAELAAWETKTTLDEVMAERRGRTWLP